MKTLLLALLVAGPVSASLIVDTDAAEQLNQAVLHAEIEILSNTAYQDADYFAFTRSLAVVRALHATRPDGEWLPRVGDAFWLDTPGGEVGNVGVQYSSAPRAYVGRRYSAALSRLGPDRFVAVAGGQGLVDRSPRRGYSRNRTDGSNGAGTGAYLHWDRTSFPVPYFISFPSLGSRLDWIDAIDASFAAWRERGDVALEFLPMGCTQSEANQNDGINSIIYVSNGWTFGPTALAITRNFYVSGDGPQAGLILDTDILINGAGYDFTTTGAAGDHDLQNVLTHEVGHFIGLGHEVTPEDNLATMKEDTVAEETHKRTLAASDIQGLLAGYSGVGQKFPLFSSAAACAFSDGIFSCASVKGRRARPDLVVWMFFALSVAFLTGRTLVRAFARRR